MKEEIHDNHCQEEQEFNGRYHQVCVKELAESFMMSFKKNIADKSSQCHEKDKLERQRGRDVLCRNDDDELQDNKPENS